MRLSAKHLTKPRMNPKSFDSDNDMKIFSKEQENGFLMQYGGASHKPDDDEFRMTEGDPSSYAYDRASSVVKKANKQNSSRQKAKNPKSIKQANSFDRAGHGTPSKKN